MYKSICNNFLASDVFAIRMAAINALSFILRSDIENVSDFDQTRSARNSRLDIFKEFFNNQSVTFSGTEMETDWQSDDVETNEISSHVQLFSSLLCANFILRKPIIFELSKLVLRYKLPLDLATRIFEKILKQLKCDAKSLMDTNGIVHLVSQWLNNGYGIDL